MPTSIAGNPASSQGGFTYAMVLVAVVVIGIVVEAGHLTTSRIVQADREAELLFRGLAYRDAIGSFYRANARYPSELADLLRDPGSTFRRHIRALYPDPMSGEGWILIRSVDGGIKGVASGSERAPLKKANFPGGLERFEEAETYADWVFEYAPVRPRVPAQPASQPAGLQP